MKSDHPPQHHSAAPAIRLFQSAICNPQSALVLAFAAMLFISWRRWSSVIADSGREMDLPLRLLRGEMLYRDVHHLYPPFSPYFNALLYRLFGVHLDVLQASGVFCALLVVVLCYRIARRLLAPREATIAMLGVIVWCIFKPAGNLIAPYAYAALHGLLWALGTLLFTLRYSVTEWRRELFCAGVLLSLAAVTKQEFALAGAATVTAALFYLHSKDWKLLAERLLCAALPALALALPVYALLFYQVGWQTLVEDCHLFYTHLPQPLLYYNARRTGLAQPFASLLQMLGAAAVGVAAVAAVIWLSARKLEVARKLLRRCGWLIMIALVVALLIRLLAHGQWDGSPLRALPLLLLIVLVVEWRRGRVDGSPALFIIAAYSLALLARVALRVPSGGAFGGFFLPTSLIVLYYLLTETLPRAVGVWTAQAPAAARARRLARGLFSAAVLLTALVFGVRYRRNFSYELQTPRGHLFTTQAVGPAYREALAFITTHTQPDEALAILPEGGDLAFLTERRAPLRHQIFIPGLLNEAEERAAIARLQAEGVRYVFVVNRPMREFGAESFGRDFYTVLGRWLDEHYQVVKICGPLRASDPQIGDQAFFIKVLARRD